MNDYRMGGTHNNNNNNKMMNKYDEKSIFSKNKDAEPYVVFKNMHLITGIVEIV